jgi:hypothetical protein
MALSLSALRTDRVLLPRYIFCSASGTQFCESQDLVRPEALGKLKKFINLIGSQTRDLPACSIVPQQLCHRVPPLLYSILQNLRCNMK